MRLVDTSCWTHALRRKGDPAVQARVRDLLASNNAAWCDPIRLELWNGASNDWDKQLLSALEAAVPVLPITPNVWQRACDLAHRARRAGVNVPSNDVLIWASSREYDLDLEHNDQHYPLLAKLK